MNPPSSESFKPVVGLSDIFVAVVTADSAASYTAGTPFELAPAIDAKVSVKTSQEVMYASNLPFESLNSEGESTITLNLSNIPLEYQAIILGKDFDPVTGRMFDSGNEASPPDMALGFRALKSNGKYVYVWYPKGHFSPPTDDASTATDKKEAKPKEIVFTALNTKRKFPYTVNGLSKTKSQKRIIGDEDSTNFSGADWFNAVQVPGISTISALALSSSVPVDDATGVNKTANLTLTYNNALEDDTVNGIVLLNASDAVIAGTITLDSTKKIVTIDPTASLAGTTAHKIVASVKDIYGQHLTSVITFTTAA
jgi:phi13 family phage major tail protein